MAQKTNTKANQSGDQAALPNQSMLCNMSNSKAQAKLNSMNIGLAGSSNWWPRGMIIGDPLFAGVEVRAAGR
jgi:hypothetical protein